MRFVDPVDIYWLSDRAVKYGFLFVLLTFGALALFEILKALPIHPLQYLLVGSALAALYGLLISEDNALLLGALLVFGLIAAAMALTRNLDWYALGRERNGG